MTITLPPELAENVRRKMESGRYRSEEEVLEHALGALELSDRRLEALREMLAVAERQADDGLAVAIDMEVFLKDVKSRRSTVAAHAE